MTEPPTGPLDVPAPGAVTLALHDLGGEGPPLLMCHPTGFHGLIWTPVAAELRDAAHLWAVDFRGHGDSTLPESGSLDWKGFADDVLAVVDAIGLGDRPALGVGHSMGGAALLLAEQAQPGTFAALWCFEPIVFPSSGHVPPQGNPLAAAARRRKAIFPDKAAALANYAVKPPLGAVAPEALTAYVDHGFRELPDGLVELKCAPETEARIFEGGAAHGAFEHLNEVRCPVIVAASGDGGIPARIAPRIADDLPEGRLEQFQDLSHFGPLEDPRGIALAIRKALL